MASAAILPWVEGKRTLWACADALGGARPAEKGSYAADFGALGKIDFKIE